MPKVASKFSCRYRAKLINRHKGMYRPIDSLERYQLPYEVKLAKLMKKKDSVFTSCCPKIDFLYKPEKKEKVNLSNNCLEVACNRIYEDTESGKNHLQNTQKTFSKHIKSITGKSLNEWYKSESSDHRNDAYKTCYLLFRLNLAFPGETGLLTKSTDYRYAEVELFSGHHSPINKQVSETNAKVLVLSTWLKEFYTNAFFHQDIVNRAIIKNLDVIFSGYMDVFMRIKQQPDPAIRIKLFTDIFKAYSNSKLPKPTLEETLSVRLLRYWQLNSWRRNLESQYNEHVLKALENALNQPKSSNESKCLNESKYNMIALGAKLFSWVFFQRELNMYSCELSEIQLLKLMEKAQRREKTIFKAFCLDIENSITITSKGIGKESKRTSLINSLELMVKNNKSILNDALHTHVRLNFNDNCELHYNYLFFRALHATEFSHLPYEHFINYLKKEKKSSISIGKFITSYINSQTLEQLNDDIRRINIYLTNHLGIQYLLLPKSIYPHR